MEPTRNTNNINASNNEPLEPVFRGMPKPGQPVASTPRVNATAPSPIATPPANLPTANSFSAQTLNQNSSQTSTPFPAHAPSALDRLMNPNIDKQTPPPVSTPPAVAPYASVPQSQPVAPVSSVFKPYTAPTPTSTPKPYTPPAAASLSSLSSSPVSPASSAPVPPVGFTSGYKVGSPLQNNSVITNPASANMAQSFNSSASGIPPAPSANITAAKLGNEVNALLNNQYKAPKSHKGTLALIISMIVVLLLLAGGGYYWYTALYLPSKDNTEKTVSNQGTSAQPATTTNKPSMFPVVAKPTVGTSTAQKPNTSVPAKPITQTTPTTPAKPVAVKTPPKVTRVVTPFNQSQRDIVGSYIAANIDKLAIPKSSMSYEVTDVTFDGPDRAVVQYSNGQSSYTAVAVASIDTANNVRIVSFSLLEK